MASTGVAAAAAVAVGSIGVAAAVEGSEVGVRTDVGGALEGTAEGVAVQPITNNETSIDAIARSSDILASMFSSVSMRLWNWPINLEGWDGTRLLSHRHLHLSTNSFSKPLTLEMADVTIAAWTH
jgi:hypothetical protein